MSLIPPSFPEKLHISLFSLQANLDGYYTLVIRIGRSLFISLEKFDLVRELDKMIFETLEEPLKAPFSAIMKVYDRYDIRESHQSYTLIGDPIDNIKVTSWDIKVKLDRIKDFVYDHATLLSSEIRFTHTSTAIVQ